jgi:intracellular multiplication protein IcmE
VVGALRDDASDSTSTRPEARERPTDGACRIGATTQASRQESGLAPQHRNGATSTSPPSSAHPERQALRKQLFDGESPSLEISKRGASSSTTTSATSTRATARGSPSSAASERFAVGAGAVESSEASVVPAVQRTAAWLERYGCAAATPSGASIKPAASAAAASASASPPAASTSHLDAGARSASAARSAAKSAARSSAKELRELGFSAAQLKDQGFSAKELLEGFSSSELIELNPRTRLGARVLGANGFRPSELMHAGITVEELRAGGWPLASLKDDLELSLGRSAVKVR